MLPSDTRPVSPILQMGQMLSGYRMTQMLYVAAELGLADCLAQGPKTLDALATETGANADALYRLMRTLASSGVFEEVDDRRFTLTPLGATLRADAEPSLRPFALSCGAPWWWNAYGALLNTVRTGTTGFDHVYGMPFFEYLAKNSDAAGTFNANMMAMTGTDARALVSAYDFSAIGHVVDIGGGHGALAAALLEAHPNVSVTIFDQPSVIDGARDLPETLAAASRCSLIAGDFFVSVPAGADVYVLKDIIHDWDDADARQILAACRTAMTAKSRLLIMERVIPPGNEPHPGKFVDITMLALTGGRERSASEYGLLLGENGFALSRIISTACSTSILEAISV